MFSASEARNLVNENGNKVKIAESISRVEALIRKKAEAGDRQVFMSFEMGNGHSSTTPVMEGTLKALKESGYSVIKGAPSVNLEGERVVDVTITW